ncbi:MAG: aminoacyl-tRNA hydrolase [Ectothiorhodospiraceae bacterium AqS1]|nr:aminoacyl-tRNA hydrolase [Ectothiorhodospiraceae bacterium AqS1]
MSAPCQLLIGLGNPGARYEATRHNAGVWLLDRVAERSCGQGFKGLPRCFGACATAEIDGLGLRLFRPETFMNESGRAVAAVASFYRIPIDGICIAHDDLDIPAGTIRLKKGGGHGGHNGLRDIVSCLGGSDFMRIRIGIGRPSDSGQAVIRYVLDRPSTLERRMIDESIDDLIEYLAPVVRGDIEKAMSVLHRRGKPSPGDIG